MKPQRVICVFDEFLISFESSKPIVAAYPAIDDLCTIMGNFIDSRKTKDACELGVVDLMSKLNLKLIHEMHFGDKAAHIKLNCSKPTLI